MSTVIRDPLTGRVLGSRAQPIWERYPTGRKNCTKCTRWRHLCDFSPRGRWIHSWCRVCRQRYVRRSDRPRQPLSTADLRRAQREWYRRWMARVKADPERHREYLETMRLKEYDRRRAAGIPERNFHHRSDTSRQLVDPTWFLEWLHWHKDEVTLTETEHRRLRDTRAGRSKQLELRVIDEIMTRHGAGHLVISFYPPDN